MRPQLKLLLAQMKAGAEALKRKAFKLHTGDEAETDPREVADADAAANSLGIAIVCLTTYLDRHTR